MGLKESNTNSDLHSLVQSNTKGKEETSMNVMQGFNQDLAFNETHLEKLEMKH